MPIRAVIFDRDGVLTHFDFTPLEALLRELAPPEASIAQLWRLWEAYSGAAALPRSVYEERGYLTRFWESVGDAWRLEAEARGRLSAFDYLETIRPFPDARRALLAARAAGLRVGVLSNFPLVSLEASLVSVGLDDLVDVARAATVLGKPKPHRDAYLQMLDALEVAPSECLMVDDEAPCVAGARAVGITAYQLDRAAPEGGPHLADLDAFAELLRA